MITPSTVLAGYGTLSLCPRVPTRVYIPGPVFSSWELGPRIPGHPEIKKCMA